MDRAPIEQPGGEFLTSGRIVLDRREGNKVFVRTLRPDEEDTGEGVNIRAGEQLIMDWHSRYVVAYLLNLGVNS